MLVVCFLFALLAACSSSEPTSARGDEPDPDAASAQAASPSSDSDDTAAPDRSDAPDDDATAVDDSSGSEGAQDATAVPSLAESGVVEIVDLGAGERIEDEAGNLISVNARMSWPESFRDLPETTREQFPFAGDLAVMNNPGPTLWAIDVAMCSAGFDNDMDGGRFFVVDSVDAPLEAQDSVVAVVESNDPVRQPGFVVPAAAECARGWLAAPWAGVEAPAFARYVLDTASDDGDSELVVYHWDLSDSEETTAQVSTDDAELSEADGLVDDAETGDADTGPTEPESIVEPFQAGRTVTFTAGDLAETAITVRGWAERIGVASEFAQTRTVTVSLAVCPGGEAAAAPEFGLGVDGWNLVAPLPGQDVTPQADSGCYDGWLDFAVPFGAVPTAFFATDGEDPVAGYAEWSLTGAAIAGP